MYLNRAEEIANIIKANTTAVSEPQEVSIPITIESSYPKVTAIDKKFSDMGINNIAPLAQNTSTAFNNNTNIHLQNGSNNYKYQKICKLDDISGQVLIKAIFNNFIFLCSKAVQWKFRDSGSYFNVYRCR
jgi:hypothetical protein